MLWRYNQMIVEQVCAPKKTKPLVAMTTSRREDAKTKLYVVGNLQAGKQKLVNLKYSQISKNIKIKLYH